MSLLFAEETLGGILLYIALGRHFIFPLVLLGWFTFLALGGHVSTFTLFLQEPYFFLSTHGYQFIDTPFVLMCVVGNFERPVLRWKMVKDVVDQEGFRNDFIEFLQLSKNVPHL